MVRLKLSALLLCVPLAFGLSGCSSGDNPHVGAVPGQFAPLHSLFEPVPVNPASTAAIPFPFNGLFSGTTDGTLNIPNTAGVPFVTAANLTDGFSTTASIFTDFLGFVDLSTASAPTDAPGLIIIDGSTGLPLVAGVDYALQTSPALDAAGVPISDYRTRILIEPLKPLKPSNTYLVAVTRNLLSTLGQPATASDEFRIVRSGTVVADQVNPFLDLLNDAQKAALETVRDVLMRPTVETFLGAYNANPAFDPDLTEDDLVLVWSFNTQSVGLTLQRLNAGATGKTITVADTTLSTGDLGLGLPNTADIYAGTFNSVPYYLLNASDLPTDPLTGFWTNDGTLNGVTGPLGIPCAVFAVPESTTLCYPDPDVQSTETLPILVTVPNANSMQSEPDDGWPVVIFQHGITGNRTNMFGIAPALAAAGFVTVAIDLPLHGITDTGNPFYTVIERTFDLDLVNNATSAPGPDGTIDSSGTHFVNLASLITSRDNLRQAVADLIHLAKSVGDIDDGNGGIAIDTDRIYFVGHSLGGMVGTALLGVNSDVRAATLAMPGGGIAKLLDASAAFGPVIAAGLGASGIAEGTDTYETFMRFAQHLVDPADPANFAAAAATGHPIHFIEVIGDTVVPNTTLASPTTATQHLTTISGFLSGSTPLYGLMGLEVVEDAPITPPVAPFSQTLGAGLRIAVPFAIGTHSSILSPAGPDGPTQFLDVTVEMQRQTANFLASDGNCLPLGGNCEAP
jgi:pimeloyl-ACP methyl ester carboxylesterase